MTELLMCTSALSACNGSSQGCVTEQYGGLLTSWQPHMLMHLHSLHKSDLIYFVPHRSILTLALGPVGTEMPVWLSPVRLPASLSALLLRVSLAPRKSKRSHDSLRLRNEWGEGALLGKY